MRVTILTLWGMYKAYPEILDEIDLPEEMDRETMKDYIFMYAGKNEARYGDPELMERLVNSWFSARKHNFGMMWRALHVDYNPIENTDRYETYNRTYTSNEEEDNSSEVSGNSQGNSTRTPNLITENSRSAYDSDVYQPLGKTAESGKEITETSSSADQKGIETRKHNKTDEEGHELHSHGNIGVTTNQQMINEELEMREYDLYKQIALLFENEFTIPVYERRCNEYGML